MFCYKCGKNTGSDSPLCPECAALEAANAAVANEAPVVTEVPVVTEEPVVTEVPAENVQESVQPQAQYAPAQQPQVQYAPAQQPQAQYAPAQQPQVQYAPAQQPQVQYTPAQQPQVQYAPAQQPQIQYAQSQNAQPTYAYASVVTPSRMAGFGRALTSAILGFVGYIWAFVSFGFIVSGYYSEMIAGFIVSMMGLPFAIVGLVLGITSLKSALAQKNQTKVTPIAPMILGIAGLSLGALSLLFIFIGFMIFVANI